MSDIARRSVQGTALKAAFALNTAAPPPLAAWTNATFNALTGIAMLMVVCLASPAHAGFFSLPRVLKSHLERLAYEVPALPPIAHSRFCLRYPEDCEVRRSFTRAALSLTDERWNELVSVNGEVNRAIAPQREVGGGAMDQWLISPKAGDCDDYAVTKRHELLEYGWPSSALVLAEVSTVQGEHHLLLVVRAREGDFALDNLAEDVRPVGMTRYRWLRAQLPDNPKFWSTVRLARSVDAAGPMRSQPRLAYFRYRAAVLHEAKTEDCCGALPFGDREGAVVAAQREQE